MHAPHECTIHGAGQEQVPLELLSSSHLITNQISAIEVPQPPLISISVCGLYGQYVWMVIMRGRGWKATHCRI